MTDEQARLEAWFDAHERDAAGPDAQGPFDDSSIPVGGAWWRAVGGTSAFWWTSVGCAVLLVGWVVGVGGWVIAEARAGDAVPAADALGTVGWIAVVVGGLVVMSLVWLAELGRRGRVVATAHRRPGVLPQGTNVSTVRLISTAAHVVWVVVVGLLAAVLLFVGFDGRWFLDEPDDGGFTLLWMFCGLVAALVTGVLAGSLLKKTWYAAGARRRAAAGSDADRVARPSRLWRWVTFRWRFDLWLCGLGAMALGLALGVVRLTTNAPPDDPMSPQDQASFHALFVWLCVGGVGLLVVGLWCASQFWRSGESIASGESFA